MSGPKPTRPIPTVQSKASPSVSRAARDKQRAARNEKWAEKQLSKVGKAGALGMLNAHPNRFTPFEMRMLIEPDESSVAAEARLAHVTHAVDSLRNMLIIVPLTLTWLSLALAGSAYQQSLIAKHPSAEPFLQQWQEGFPNLTSVNLWLWHISLINGHRHWFTFAGFALLDACLLGLLLILTIVGQTFEYWAYLRANRLSAYLETFLHDLNRRSLLRLETEPDTALPPWLRELREQLGQLGDVISKMNSGLDASLSSYTGALDAQRQAVGELVDDSKKARRAIRELNLLFQSGVEAQRIYQGNIPAISRNFESLTQSQEASAESFRAMTAMLAKTMEYLAQSVGRLPEAQRLIHQYQSVVAPPQPPRARWQYRPPAPGMHSYRAPQQGMPAPPTSRVATQDDDDESTDDADDTEYPEMIEPAGWGERIMRTVGVPLRLLRRRGK